MLASPRQIVSFAQSIGLGSDGRLLSGLLDMMPPAKRLHVVDIIRAASPYFVNVIGFPFRVVDAADSTDTGIPVLDALAKKLVADDGHATSSIISRSSSSLLTPGKSCVIIRLE